MASFTPANSHHLQQPQFNPLVHLCITDVSFISEGCLTLHLKSSNTDPGYCQGCSLLIAPLLSGQLTVDCTVSLFCLCCASPQEVLLPAFRQCRIPTIRLPVWGLPHQSQSHLNPLHFLPTSQYSYRVLCISQLQDWHCHYSGRSWAATLAYPNTGVLGKQVLHPLYLNSTFYPSEGSWDAGHIMPFRTGDMELATRT